MLQKYSLPAIIIHWIMAILVIGMVPFGWYMSDLDFSPDKLQFYAWHKSIGVTILALFFLRLFWRLYKGVPAPLPHKMWEEKLSKATHVLLYVLIAIMPLTGWLMSSANGFPVSVWSAFVLPDLIDKNQELGKLLNNIHSKIAWAIIIVAGLHLLGALKHHFIDKDNTLRRMLPVLLCLLPFSVQAQESTIQQWKIIPERSEIVFIAQWDASDVRGNFSKFEGEIFFDKDNLEQSYARIAIDMTSFDTGYLERDEEIAGTNWFDLASFSKAQFDTTAIIKDISTGSDNDYIAQGSLSLKGQTKPLNLPFSIEYDDDGNVLMKGETNLSRLAFDIGQAGWQSTEIIKENVEIKIELAARPVNPVE
jgi:cytochrome b561